VSPFLMGTAIVLATVATAVPAATFTWLGDLPGGDTYSAATAVSANGTVVVGYSGSANGEEAFRYENGLMTGLGDLPGRTPFESRPASVSADGAIVAGTSGRYGGTHEPQAFLWSSGVLTGLGYLPSSHSSPVSFGSDLSDDGSVLVGSSSADNGVTAVVYRNGAWEDLGIFPTYADSYGSAISPGGEVIAGFGLGEYDIYGKAFLVRDSVITPLGNLPPGERQSEVLDISAGGTVLVGITVLSGDVWEYYEAFRFTDATMTLLGFLPGGENSFATGVSADGAVVVGASDAVIPNGAGNLAFIWTAAQGMRMLHDVLLTQRAVGFKRNTWLSSATGVSADGLTIVGFGSRAGFQRIQAWVAVLDSPIAADTDADGVLDGVDNCILVPNPAQLDADYDKYGNACDGDLNDSGRVTAADYAMLRSVIGQSASPGSLAAAADLNGSGSVTAADYAILRSLMNSAPGPSGLFY
jgi:probable HAF family extracellular repeat protein